MKIFLQSLHRLFNLLSGRLIHSRLIRIIPQYLGLELHMLPHNLDLGPGLTRIIGPAVLFKPAYDTDSPALVKVLFAGFGYFGPDFHIKVGHFAVAHAVLFEITVGGDDKLTQRCPPGCKPALGVRTRFPSTIILFNWFIYLSL